MKEREITKGYIMKCIAKGLEFVHVERFDEETMAALSKLANMAEFLLRVYERLGLCVLINNCVTSIGCYVIEMPDGTIHVCDADEFAEKYEVDNVGEVEGEFKVYYDGEVLKAEEVDPETITLLFENGDTKNLLYSDVLIVPDDAEMVDDKMVRIVEDSVCTGCCFLDDCRNGGACRLSEDEMEAKNGYHFEEINLGAEQQEAK